MIPCLTLLYGDRPHCRRRLPCIWITSLGTLKFALELAFLHQKYELRLARIDTNSRWQTRTHRSARRRVHFHTSTSVHSSVFEFSCNCTRQIAKRSLCVCKINRYEKPHRQRKGQSPGSERNRRPGKQRRLHQLFWVDQFCKIVSDYQLVELGIRVLLITTHRIHCQNISIFELVLVASVVVHYKSCWFSCAESIWIQFLILF